MALNHILSDLYVRRDSAKIKIIKEELETKKQELDTFFDEYLEVFDDKLNANVDKQDIPEWRAYNNKYAEYTALNKDLKLAEYYLGII